VACISSRLSQRINQLILTFPVEVQEFFLELLHAERSLHTIDNYAYDFSVFYHFLKQQNLSLSQVEGTTLRSFFRYLERGYTKTIDLPQQGTRTCFRRNSKSGKQRKQAFLRTLFRYLTRNQFLPRDPMLSYQNTSLRVRDGRVLPVFLTAEESQRLIQTVREYPPSERKKLTWLKARDLAVILLFLHTGIRVGELIQLRLHHIQRDQKASYLHVMGKGKKERRLKLNQQVMQALDAYLQERPSSESRFLFMNKNKKGLSRKGINDLLQKYVGVAGLPTKTSSLSPHKLRHTHATLLLSRQASLPLVGAVLGHENIQTTQRYTHVVDAEKDQVLDRLGELLGNEIDE
jgi:integrase/recombinase XerD